MYFKLNGLLTIRFKETAVDSSMANLVAKESGDHVEQKGLCRMGWRKKMNVYQCTFQAWEHR